MESDEGRRSSCQACHVKLLERAIVKKEQNTSSEPEQREQQGVSEPEVPPDGQFHAFNWVPAIQREPSPA